MSKLIDAVAQATTGDQYAHAAGLGFLKGLLPHLEDIMDAVQQHAQDLSAKLVAMDQVLDQSDEPVPMHIIDATDAAYELVRQINLLAATRENYLRFLTRAAEQKQKAA